MPKKGSVNIDSMKLDPEFYQNLFKSLGKQKPHPPHPMGWGCSKELTALMQRLMEDSSSRHVFIVDRSGKQSASYGDLGFIDITDFTALVVAKTLASNALSEVVDNHPFSTASIEGKKWGAYFAALGSSNVLIVVFDHQTNVDRVSMRVKRALPAFEQALQAATQ